MLREGERLVHVVCRDGRCAVLVVPASMDLAAERARWGRLRAEWVRVMPQPKLQTWIAWLLLHGARAVAAEEIEQWPEEDY